MHQKLILLREKKQAHDDDPRGKCTRGYKYKFSHMPLILKKRKRKPPTTTTITSICHKKSSLYVVKKVQPDLASTTISVLAPNCNFLVAFTLFRLLFF